MKRFHVHLSVDNLEKNIIFYSRLFDCKPTRQREDYAQWLLDDPALNFALSTRGSTAGLDHFGMQAENAEELKELRRRAETASLDTVLDQGDTTCCYAHSRKHWSLDPQGLAWEHFHTLGEAHAFGEAGEQESSACCIPLFRQVHQPGEQKSVCCSNAKQAD